MPSHFCKWPTCNAILPTIGYCAAHAQHLNDEARHYDQHQRDRQSKAFYNSAVWQSARATKLAHTPVCERCQREFATVVHHRAEVRAIRDASPELLTAESNLESLCASCHTKHHKRRGAA